MDLMRSALRKIDIEPLPGKRRTEADFLWPHWVEKLHFLFMVKLLVATQKRIIWNVHNRLPHDTKHLHKARAFMRLLARISYKIVIHCTQTREVLQALCGDDPAIFDKVVLVPHPNYIGAYGAEKSAHGLDDNKLSLCFFGKVKAYKNIELLIAALNELNFDDVELEIKGRCWNKHYFEQLIGDNPRIKTDFRFIEDNEISDIAAGCHLFVSPYNLASSLNSGTTLLAFSYGRSVLSSLTGTLADITDKSLFFSYTYQNREDHKKALKQQLTAIRETYKGHYNDLLALGAQCRDYVRENNSLERVAERLSTVFTDRQHAPKNSKTRLACTTLAVMIPVTRILMLFKKAIAILRHH